ncbi:MAG TPA: BCD family MFS transporter [Sandaracinaceae bacterium LLY-WYZ-13_1]|nr:BCD family MFS transporter [Sandaracinaceae bacterium LLY-WYZ-13_1]
MGTNRRDFGWLSIVRLGVVQAALGAVVVLTTSTLNRVMVVELALAAMVPGALVTLHHAMQLLRPRMGYGSDVGRRRSPWIVGGMAALAVGGVGASGATALMETHLAAGLALALVSYALIGGGVSAGGTSLLVLMAKRVAAPRRAAAATIVWLMMIFGFAVTATVVGKLLDPFSSERLMLVTAGLCVLAFAVTLVATWGLEGRADDGAEAAEGAAPDAETSARRPAFREALRQVWAEPNARRFTLFVFVSMLAYSAQDLILEPFAGAVFGWTPGESTQLAGAQHAGVFVGMLLVAAVTTIFKGTAMASLKGWVVGGCLASGLAMLGLFAAGLHGPPWPLQANVFVLGLANGAFSIAAIASMMTLAGRGRASREGTRMGLWGAAQAIAFGAGGFLGTVLADGVEWIVGSSGAAYAGVFGLEAVGFFAAQYLATRTRFEATGDAPDASGTPAPEPDATGALGVAYQPEGA